MNELIRFEYIETHDKTHDEMHDEMHDKEKQILFGELRSGGICVCDSDGMFTFEEMRLLIKLPENSTYGPLSVNAYDILNEKTCYIPDTVKVTKFVGRMTLKGKNVYQNMSATASTFMRINFDNEDYNNNYYNSVANYGPRFSTFLKIDYNGYPKKLKWKNNVEVEFNILS